jgi:hypothetical protein
MYMHMYVNAFNIQGESLEGSLLALAAILFCFSCDILLKCRLIDTISKLGFLHLVRLSSDRADVLTLLHDVMCFNGSIKAVIVCTGYIIVIDIWPAS